MKSRRVFLRVPLAVAALVCAEPTVVHAVGGTFQLYNQLVLSVVSRDSGFDKTASRPFKVVLLYDPADKRSDIKSQQHLQAFEATPGKIAGRPVVAVRVASNDAKAIEAAADGASLAFAFQPAELPAPFKRNGVYLVSDRFDHCRNEGFLLCAELSDKFVLSFGQSAVEGPYKNRFAADLVEKIGAIR